MEFNNKNIYKMKGIIKSMLLVAGLLVAMPLHAQMVSNNNEDGVNKVDRSAMRYRPGEVIVKFKDSTPISPAKVQGKFKASGISAVDRVFKELGVKEVDQLMPLTGEIKNRAPRKVRSKSGRMITEPDMSKLFCLKYEAAEGQTVEETVERLKAMPEVEYAEPNYLAFIQVSTESTEDLLTYINEPMYSQQWGLNAIKMPQVWAMPKVTEQRPIIAILDTGVDINHPDLKDNIWTNAAEAGGATWEDDDHNGYVDDLHGWDFIAKTAIMKNGMDRNGHGTHCAGIAAAVGNNGIGIVGANPDALILPIKVMGDDGSGDIATICKGIDYAVACGANVLSMSFGGVASQAEYQSLTKAAASYAVLVSAAGNSGYDIYKIFPGLSPSFPGAYDIVIGVMASNSDGSLASFSNYDPDGPFFSEYNMNKSFSSDYNWNDETMWNYDVMAPGVNIMSTYLNGTYKTLNGTSMATPMVAGAISRLLQVKGFDYAMDYGLLGDMAMAKNCNYLDFGQFDASMVANFNEDNRQVALALIDLEIDDSEGDGDGRFDAGETISLYPTIRSIWGHAENIKISIEKYDDNVPDSALTILENNVDFGWSLNSRGSFKSKNPIRVKVNNNANDGLSLPYKIVITSNNLVQGVEQEHIFEVENGIELGGMISEDLTLYPNVHYIVTKNISIPEGVILKIEPGTIIKFCDSFGISCNGIIQAIGTPDKPIIFKGDELLHNYFGGFKINNGGSIFRYCKFQDLNSYIYSYFSTSLKNYNDITIQDCIFRNTNFFASLFNFGNNWANHLISSNNFLNLSGEIFHFQGYYNNKNLTNICYNNFIGNKGELYDIVKNDNYAHSFKNNLFANDASGYNLWYYDDNSVTKSLPEMYLGTSLRKKAKQSIGDTDSGIGFAKFTLEKMLSRPVKEAHGIVWKVVVDGYDAQDEFDEMPPLGVGRHEFKVFYNRDDIDTTYTPIVAMGLKSPYTQRPINKDGHWSIEDSVSVYTVYLDIDGKFNSDGLNRISVTGGKDHDHFDIPDETYRYNVLVQSAGSMSTGLMAEAGLGQVKLTWQTDERDFADLLGYNLFRYTTREEKYWDYDENWNWTEFTRIVNDTIMLNEQILDASVNEFNDYDVTPGTTYYYLVKEIGTDLQQNDVSNVVAATPLTSTLGDANGSGAVDVADVITTVNYAAGMEPRPFIFDAADMNVDKTIDILDVIGIIKRIYNPNAENNTAGVEAVAEYTVEDGIVYVDCPIELAGVQVQLAADEQSDITVADDLKGFEHMGAWIADNDYLFLAYNMAGRTLTACKHAILNIGDKEITNIVLSDKNGHNVQVMEGVTTGINTVTVAGNKQHGVYDIMGRKVANDAASLSKLSRGIYIVNGKKIVNK